MNKTVTVNIGGIVFHIDENAYERFKKYLESIRAHFTASEGRDEIMQDIESRIAEMFQERIKDQKQVITLEDVDEVTAIMGKPEDFSSEESGEKKDESSQEEIHVKRRLFRNPDDKLLGGVCSGISAYFDIDPVWIRLIFAFSFFVWGSGFLLYLVLWIIIPKAVTTADKLQMKGEPVTINNIEKNVQEELESVKKNLDDLRKGKKPGNFVSRIFEGIGEIFKLIFVFIGKLFAVFFVLIGLLICFVMFVSLLAVFKFPGTQYPEILNQIFPTQVQFGLALVSGLLVAGIPFIMLAYFGARALFNIKKSSRIVNLSALGLWLAALSVCSVIGYSIAKDFSEKQSVRERIYINQPSSKTLVLKLNKKTESEKEYDRWDDDDWNGDLHLSVKDNQLQSRDIKLDIVESQSDSFELVQICYARGETRKMAEDRATKLSYSLKQMDSVIVFDPYFGIDKSEKYHAQKMQLILKVPAGGKVFLDKSLRGFIYDIKNVDNIYDSDMLNRHWEMQDNGLNCIDCDGTESNTAGEAVEINIHDHVRHNIHTHGVRVDKNGVYIRGDDDKSITIDSNGVNIH